MSELRNYELCYILKTDAPKDKTEDVQKKIQSIVKEKGGQIEVIDEWASKDLAHIINKEKKGRFTFVQIKSGSEVLPTLKHYLTFNEDVLRHDIFRYPEQYEYQDMMKRISAWNEPTA